MSSAGEAKGSGGPPHLVVPGTDVHRLASLFLERTQDVIVLGLGLALFALMLRTLVELFIELFAPTIDFRSIIADVLFILVMVELVRLLLVYLREHRVAVDFMVELGIVSTLREIVLHGVIELQWPQIVAIALFLLVLGALLRFGDFRAGQAGTVGEEPWRVPANGARSELGGRTVATSTHDGR